ncbi:MAG: glycosyltransferase family 4 protein [Bacilli bacterium]|nr:glycosyltransferase family 4 protein [Bacilli bacterium]
MKKIRVNMLSMADSVDGQGVGSAYLELMKLLKEDGKDTFEILLNDKIKNSDIIHAHTVEPRNYLKIKRAKVPTVAYVHFLPDTLDGSIKLPKPIFKIFKKYVISFYKSADNLVVVNPIFKKDMIKAGLKEEKITYIPNFVSKEKFYKKTDKEIIDIRKKYNLDKNDFVVLGAGQVQNRKGVLDFVEVAKKLPDIKFIWAGGFSFGAITDGHEKLKKVMDNPPKNVKFLGIIPRSDMNDLFNACDLLFVPSYNELFPMTILEACSTDTPILLRDLELYEDILFKKYLKADNNEDFAKIIKNLKDDKKLYKEAVENAKYISKFYSKDNIYKMWKEFYTNIIKKEK